MGQMVISDGVSVQCGLLSKFSEMDNDFSMLVVFKISNKNVDFFL